MRSSYEIINKTDMIMTVALLYVCTKLSYRGIGNKLGISKTTVGIYLLKDIASVDPVLSKIVRRKAAMYKKQKYNFALNKSEQKIIQAEKTAKYLKEL